LKISQLSNRILSTISELWDDTQCLKGEESLKLIKAKVSNHHIKLAGFILLPIIVLIIFYSYLRTLNQEIHYMLFFLTFLFGFSFALVGAKWIEIQMQVQLKNMQKEMDELRDSDKILSVRNDRLKDIAKSVNDLSSAHKMNQLIIDTLPVGIILFDKNGRASYINKVLAQLTGYTKQEISQFTTSGNVKHKDQNNFWETVGSVQEIFRREELCPIKGGIEVPVLISTHPIYNDNNQLFAIVSSIMDISEQKRLSKVEEHAKVILDHITDGVMTVDNNGIINGFNRGAEEMTGIEANKVLGKKYDDVFIKTRSIFTKLTKTLYSNIEYTNFKKEMKTLEGKIVFLMITTKILFNKKGEKIGAIGIYKDITPMVELEDQIQRADKLAVVGELAAGTAHEIRNPLTTIQGFIQLLAKDPQMNSNQQYIQLILQEITHINDIIKEMILLAKPNYPQKSAVSLNKTLKETIIFMQTEGSLHNIEYKTNLQEVPLIEIDDRQIKQVFINIIRNAIQSMRNGGKLLINSSLNDLTKKIEVTFIDEGIGIAEEALQKIYEPFYTTKEEGTGLGIPVSCRIMQNHGGSLKLTSEEGKGTKVLLTFPIDMDS